ncbi:hypothetical protein [Streptomyces sp. NPDC048191]|uniref:hypothetical protein n=1 Tax=Streptomyces sp. NPDC048191 TaxID=3155484 RepID=UPI0033C719EC
MDTSDRRAPRSPATIVPPLLDNGGFLGRRDCGAPARARFAIVLAGAPQVDAPAVRLIAQKLGLTEDDLLLARDILRSRHARKETGEARTHKRNGKDVPGIHSPEQ